MDLAEYYRQSCLINHYKRMLGNNLVKEWLPDTCLGLTDKLIILSHYLAEMRPFVGTSEIALQPYEFLADADIRAIESCEKMLDTPRIYSFLRGEGTSEEEKNYIESEKKKTLERK
jgi:hypothetical protein